MGKEEKEDLEEAEADSEEAEDLVEEKAGEDFSIEEF